MECELLRSPMISYRSLLYNTTVLYDSSSFSVTIPLQQNVCLLKTAIGTIVHDSRNVKAKILLDGGSQRSFVTEDLVKSLGLQPYSQRESTFCLLALHAHLAIH